MGPAGKMPVSDADVEMFAVDDAHARMDQTPSPMAAASSSPKAKARSAVRRLGLARALGAIFRRQRSRSAGQLELDAPVAQLTKTASSQDLAAAVAASHASSVWETLLARQPGDSSSAGSSASRASIVSCPSIVQPEPGDDWLDDDDLNIFAEIPSPRYQTFATNDYF